MMLSNFDFLDLRPEDSVGFISETRRKSSCSVQCNAMADGGCICCDRMMMCSTRSAVFLSYEKRVPYFCRTRKELAETSLT